MKTQELVKVKPVTVDGIRFYASPDGSETGVSISGLARLAGTNDSSVYRALGLNKDRDYTVAVWLKHLEGGLISSKVEGIDGTKVVTPQAAAKVITHYAYESKAANDVARRSLQQFTALGMENWMRSQIKKATSSREALAAHLDNVFHNSPDTAAKAEAVDTEILDTVKQLTERVEALQKALHKMNEQPQNNVQQQQDKETVKPVKQEEKYYTVKEYLSSKGLVMSVNDLSAFGCAVCKEYRAINNKRPQRTKSCGSCAYSAADFPLLDGVLIKHLGL